MSSESGSHQLAAGTEIRDYTIVSVIGTGGFSIVYKAIDNALRREVAIKEYFPAAMALRAVDGTIAPHSRDAATFSKGIESFLNEGKLLAAFDHPALVRVYRCWEERGTAYIAMRLYSGITLRDAVLAGDWRADEASLHALLAPMCDALELLHASKCYHRDVAPDNIMLVDNGAPVLLDFGAARKAIESTQVFTAILKPGYAPIEQYGDGELKQGPWTDIYALAGVVHFTLAGTAPPTAINRMIKDAMPRPRDAFSGRLPEHWLDAIEAALSVKPEARPQSIDEFRALFRWQQMALVPAVAAEPVPKEIAAPPPSEALVEQDDESTVVMPRKASDGLVAIARATPASAAEATLVAKPTSTRSSLPRRRASVLLWLVALFGAVAAAFFGWKLSSAPVSPALAPPSAVSPPVTAPANPPDVAIEAEKSSISRQTTEAVKAGVPEIAAPAIVTSVPAEARIEKSKARKLTPPAADGKATATDVGASSRTGARPERCTSLIERFGLGELLSAEDQRFIRERCR